MRDVKNDSIRLLNREELASPEKRRNSTIAKNWHEIKVNSLTKSSQDVKIEFITTQDLNKNS